MIIGVGIDIVDVPRIAQFRERYGERGLRRVFTPAELEYCLGLAVHDPSLAVRFAAKEALFKALGTGQARGGAWTDVEVLRDENGAPSLRLHGRAAENAAARDVARMHVSLSHTDALAVAQVVLER